MPTAVLSIGSINADMVFRVPRGVRAGETALAQGFLRTSGGKAANRAVQARCLGVAARLFGCVGDDDLAGVALNGPASAAVDLGGVGVASGATGVAAILVDDSGEKTIVLAGNAHESWPPDYAARLTEALSTVDRGAVLAVDLEVTPSSLIEVLRGAEARGLPVVLDPSPPERVTPTCGRAWTMSLPTPPKPPN